MKRKNKISSSHAMKLYKKIGGVALLILNVGAGWRWVLSFMPGQLYIAASRARLADMEMSNIFWFFRQPNPMSSSP